MGQKPDMDTNKAFQGLLRRVSLDDGTSAHRILDLCLDDEALFCSLYEQMRPDLLEHLHKNPKNAHAIVEKLSDALISGVEMFGPDKLTQMREDLAPWMTNKALATVAMAAGEEPAMKWPTHDYVEEARTLLVTKGYDRARAKLRILPNLDDEAQTNNRTRMALRTFMAEITSAEDTTFHLAQKDFPWMGAMALSNTDRNTTRRFIQKATEQEFHEALNDPRVPERMKQWPGLLGEAHCSQYGMRTSPARELRQFLTHCMELIHDFARLEKPDHATRLQQYLQVACEANQSFILKTCEEADQRTNPTHQQFGRRDHENAPSYLIRLALNERLPSGAQGDREAKEVKELWDKWSTLMRLQQSVQQEAAPTKPRMKP